MSKGTIKDAIVQVARGEPMNVLKERHLAEELRRNPALRDEFEAQKRLSSRLDELKRAIRRVEAPNDLADILTAAGSAPVPRASFRRVSYATASSLVAALAALALGPMLLDFDQAERGSERGQESGDDIETVADPADYFDEFLPLPSYYYAGLSSMGAYSIVRVKMPLSSVNFVDGQSGDGWSIEADVILGEDGLARGIRFAEAEIVLEEE